MDPGHWLTDRTYRGADYDPAELAAIAAARGTRITVCLPMLDVADTVGPIVEGVRRELMERVPLVSELMVVDTGSEDASCARAAEAGARVWRAGEILPTLPPQRGKGDALWKSLAVAEGELIVWLDSDVTDPDPAFVPGLLGPLLADPEVDYVKAVYTRALGDDPEGGGRVTEICARPLLNMFYPELTGLAQPLSGEAAGRREVLMGIPFFSGYAVETGLLIDLLGARGLGALAQVDLGARRHTNQATTTLGAMASSIAQAVLLRVAEEGRAPADLAGDGRYVRPVRVGGEWVMHDIETRPAQRPAMRGVLAAVGA
ncbi:MAG: glucosyl-3-phosphoglycerate synthase [Miltoncostaeaceae bacterium]